MNKSIVNSGKTFESIKHLDEQSGAEFWSARELMMALEYNNWESFERTIKRAMKNAEKTYYNIKEHFRPKTKMVEIGSNAVRPVKDFSLSRYACYMIALNGDPAKQAVADAKTYFATKTRQKELDEEREEIERRIDARRKYTKSDQQLSATVLDHDVDRKGLALIKSDGDRKLFGGKNTAQMKKQYGLTKSQNLPDRLPSVTLAAKQLANEITAFNTNAKDLRGFAPIDGEHRTNNAKVRQTLTERGIKPETLSPEEDIKKVEKRLNSSRQKGLTDETL
jgi:DNA-damage-inducible protein D